MILLYWVAISFVMFLLTLTWGYSKLNKNTVDSLSISQHYIFWVIAPAMFIIGIVINLWISKKGKRQADVSYFIRHFLSDLVLFDLWVYEVRFEGDLVKIVNDLEDAKKIVRRKMRLHDYVYWQIHEYNLWQQINRWWRAFKWDYFKVLPKTANHHYVIYFYSTQKNNFIKSHKVSIKITNP